MSTALPADAGEVSLPKAVTWTTYESGSLAYTQSVALGDMLKKKYGVELSLIPASGDIGRQTALKAGQLKLCACGIGTYFAQEGVLMFAGKAWGPQRIFNLFNAVGTNGQQLAVSEASGIRTPADLKGKRVTFVRGVPTLNLNTEAMLAFAGLTWHDVERIDVSGWGKSIQAVIDGRAGAAWGTTTTSYFRKLIE